jgi:hypothetical protein
MIWPFTKRWKQEAAESDYGRRYGWTVEVDEIPIGQLSYVRWDDNAQFWHEYRLELDGNNYHELRTDANLWCKSNIALRNNRFRDIVIKEFLATPKPDKTIMVRFASVPLERFRKP